MECTFDGTWLTCGHSSHISMGMAVEMENGLIVDMEIVSNYCWSCYVKEKKLNREKFRKWQAMQLCNKNFDGTAGAMEVAVAVRIRQRSTQCGFRYTTFIEDGDSKLCPM